MFCNAFSVIDYDIAIVLLLSITYVYTSTQHWKIQYTECTVHSHSGRTPS